MTITDTTVDNLIINTMTQAQYSTITPSSTELYMITDIIPLSQSDITTTLSTASTDATIPSAKCVYDSLEGKQATLVSGTNIKTINNESLLGSGNITIQTGGTSTDVQINGISITSNNVANIVTNTAYNATSNKIATMNDVPAAQVNSDWNASSGVSQILNKPSLATVAMSGSYNDLSNKPTIPVVPTIATSVTSSSTNAETVGAKLFYDTTANMQTTSNLVTSISTLSTDTTYPSAKCVYNALQNVEIDVDSALSSTSENPVQNKVINSALNNKVNTSDYVAYASSEVQTLWSSI